jgi:drug/metabolite transporter (DMT)-like permease
LHKKQREPPESGSLLVVSTWYFAYGLISPSVQRTAWISVLFVQFFANFILFHCPFVPVYFTEVKDLQFLKALPPILVTLLGMVIDVKKEQSAKA